MSLISDALKKAQRARSPDLPAGTMSGFRRASGVPPKTVALIAIGAAVFVGIGALAIVLILRRGDQAALAAAKSAPAPAATSSATTVPGVPVPQSRDLATAGPSIPEANLPAAKAAAPAPAAPAPGPAQAATTVAAAKAPPMAAVPPAAAAGKEDIRIASFIDEIKIILLTARTEKDQSKVMLRVRGKDFLIFRINEMVDREMNIRLTEIEENHLTFVDGNGVAYIKRN